MNTLKELVEKNRSYRRFFEDEVIEREVLMRLVDLARLSASGANLQPLKFKLYNDPKKNALIFPYLSWAGYLKDWTGPKAGERPAAYILILGDLDIRKSFGCDHGIAAQSILLGATELDYGGCILSSIDRDGLRTVLNISSQYELLLVIAIGKPVECVVIDTVGSDGDIKYWRDEDEIHHIPKKDLDDLILD